MKLNNPWKDLTKFELILWLTSAMVVSVSFLLVPEKDYYTLIASLVGVTALIFVAKGYVIGQILTVIFALFYGVISFYFQYYGEMITYLAMTAPIAIMAVVSWVRHPYEETQEVEVNEMTKCQTIIMFGWTAIITVVFYYILEKLGTKNLPFSTLSVATSFLASYLTFMRSPYYALAYAANDIVLIILWVLATINDVQYLPMIVCFAMFFANDMYGFWNWLKMKKRQENGRDSIR